MRKGNVFVYYGKGKGKTSLAIGRGIHELSQGHSVIMVRFMGCDNKTEIEPLKNLSQILEYFVLKKQEILWTKQMNV